MANNRLYLEDGQGDRFMLAKSMGAGWYIADYNGAEEWVARLDKWLRAASHYDYSAWGAGSYPTTMRVIDENHPEVCCEREKAQENEAKDVLATLFGIKLRRV